MAPHPRPPAPGDRFIRGLKTPPDQRPGLRKPVDQRARSELQQGKHVFSNPVTHTQWMKATEADWRHPRSLRLRALDNAVRCWKASDKDSLPKLQFALMNWIAHKEDSKDWKTSIRNRNGAVEILRQQAFQGYAGGRGAYPIWLPNLSPSEMKALDFQIQQARSCFDRYFLPDGEPLRMELKLAAVAKEAEEKGRGLYKKFKEDLEKARGGAGADQGAAGGTDKSKIEDAIARLFGEERMSDLRNLAGDGWIAAQVQAEFGTGIVNLVSDITDMIPLLSSLKGGVDVVVAWGKAAKKTYEIKTFGDKKVNVQAGDMRLAYASFLKLVKVDAAKAFKEAAVKTVKTITDAATQGAGSPFSKTFKSLAALAARIFTFALQLREQHTFNKIVKSPKLEDRRKLLSECPFAACLLLAHGGTSDVLSFGAYQFGSLQWKDDVAGLIKSTIAPIKKRAQGYLAQYPFTVPNFHLTPL